MAVNRTLSEREKVKIKSEPIDVESGNESDGDESNDFVFKTNAPPEPQPKTKAKGKVKGKTKGKRKRSTGANSRKVRIQVEQVVNGDNTHHILFKSHAPAPPPPKTRSKTKSKRTSSNKKGKTKTKPTEPEPAPIVGKVRYSNQAKKLALRSMKTQSAHQAAKLISPTCGSSTTGRWRREHDEAKIGRDMLGKMIENVSEGRPIDHDILFAPVPVAAFVQMEEN